MTSMQHSGQSGQMESEGDYNRLVGFARHRVQPFQAIYVTRDDLLTLKIWSPTVATTTQLSLRFMAADGTIVPQFESFAALTAGTAPAAHTLQGAEGWLISASIATPGAPRGQVYTMLEIARGGGSQDVTAGHVLIAGYPGSAGMLGYPQSPVQSPLDGRGWIFTFTIANPAAGADFSVTVPAGEQWILRSMAAVLATSAAAATRTPVLLIMDGSGNVSMAAGQGDAMAASTTWTWSFYPGATDLGVSTSPAHAPIPPDLRLPPGYVIKSSTAGLQAGDQWSAIALMIERFVNA